MRINMVKDISEIRNHTKKVKVRKVVSVWIVLLCDCGAARRLLPPCPASQEVGKGVQIFPEKHSPL